MLVLVTGATGFAGAALVPRLVDDGHEVRALARNPDAVVPGALPAGVPVVRGDVVSGEGIDAALDGVDVAYYLVHSMESGDGSPFADRELRAAEGFADAARRAGVRRIVYLGVMVPTGRGLSPHLASRLRTEEALLEGAPEALSLRASIAIGHRSRSFRFLVRLVERAPVLPLPPWRDHRTQPIDGRDLVAALRAAATTDLLDGGTHRTLDVAGPDVVSYGGLVETIRDLLIVRRPTLPFPLAITPIAGRVAAVLAGEDAELVLPLMGGLDGDLLASGENGLAALGVRAHRLDAAVEHALAAWERVEPLRAR